MKLVWIERITAKSFNFFKLNAESHQDIPIFKKYISCYSNSSFFSIFSCNRNESFTSDSLVSFFIYTYPYCEFQNVYPPKKLTKVDQKPTETFMKILKCWWSKNHKINKKLNNFENIDVPRCGFYSDRQKYAIFLITKLSVYNYFYHQQVAFRLCHNFVHRRSTLSTHLG